MTRTKDELDGIAIIAMSGRFPGAPDVESLWRRLREGTELVSFFSREELLAAGEDPALIDNNPRYVRARPILEDIECFDASFFGFSPGEARLIGPERRLLLEGAWEALELAGCEPSRSDVSIGVFVGSSPSSYWLDHIRMHPTFRSMLDDFEMETLNDKDSLATGLSYKLDLTGPSLTVQTFCSTSLTAVHMACQSLLSGECDLALAGGVACRLPQVKGHVYQEGSIRSPDGHTRTFDAKAQGTLFGNGMGLVLLERLHDALANRDPIHAVIRGSAINNDGARKVSYSGPSLIGQSKAVAEAIAISGVSADSIGYVEAHGTGTPVGDPVEVKALTRAFRETTEQTGYCAIGSVKTNLGHLESASGITGLIKATLCVEHGEIPPCLHFETPNPALKLDKSPFFVNTELRDWPLAEDSGPRRAGVSSLGIGGTNVHVVLQEPPVRPPSGPSRSHQLLLWSARSEQAADRATAQMANYLAEKAPRLADAAFTLHTGRRAFEHRRALVCRDNRDADQDAHDDRNRQDLKSAIEAMRTGDGSRVLRGACPAGARSIAFLFPGAGAQYPGMARGLYRTEAVYRDTIDACAESFRTHLSVALCDFLYSKVGADGDRDAGRPALALPALFATEVALARLLMSWGVQARVLMGHSVGEYAAAHLADVFSLDDACALVALRGRLFETLPAGAMLATPIPASELAPLLGDQLSLAADNGPQFTVASGPIAAIEALQATLSERGVDGRRLHIDIAAHSDMLAPILDEFRTGVARMRLSEPRIPVVSCATGTWLTAEEAIDPDYWMRQLRHTVRFADGLKTLLQEPKRAFLEVGPGQTLATFTRSHPERQREQWVATTVRHPKDERDDVEVLLTTLGNLWVAGVEFDDTVFWGEQERYKVPLPTYPFERERHWIERPSPTESVVAQAVAHSLRPDAKRPMDTWFYEPRWLPASLPSSRASSSERTSTSELEARRWLVLADDSALAEALITRLTTAGASVVVVRAGASFERVPVAGPNATDIERYQIALERAGDYRELMRAVLAGGAPQRVVHAWTVNQPAVGSIEPIARFSTAQHRGFYSLLYLAQAIHHEAVKTPIHIDVLSAGLHAIRHGEVSRPEHATLMACCRVLPQEMLSLTCRCIDLDGSVATAPGNGGQVEILTNRVLAELERAPSPDVIAWRGGERLILEYAPIECPSPSASESPLRRGGVYLITGGLGDIGMAFAEHLARRVDARLVLTSRSGLPPRDQWQRLLTDLDERALVRRRIERIQAIEAVGGEVSVVSADVADAARMRELIAWCHDHHGGLHGIIHSAGTVDEHAFKAVLETDQAICEAHFKPKIHGLYALEQALEKSDATPDFVLLMSSIASVLGGLGHLPYSAANLVLDAFAQQHRDDGSPRWLSVGWDIFRFGKARDLERIVGATVTAVGRTLESLGLALDEGNQALDRVLAAGRPHVVVSTGDLQARIDQWVRLESLRSAPADRAPASPGHNSEDARLSSTQTALRQMWRDILGVEEIGLHDDFFDLGGHSLLALRLFAMIEARFSQSLPLAILFQHSTVAKLAALLDQQDAPTPSRLIMPIREGGTRGPLFWVHGLGGDLLRYERFLRHLGPDQSVFGIQAPDEPFDTVEDMAAAYAEELMRFFPGERYAIGGHSFGGSLAFELACQLRLRDQDVRFLGILDTDNENLYFSLEPAFLRHASSHLASWTRAFWARPREQKLASARRLGGKVRAMSKLRRPEKTVGGVIDMTGYPEDRVRYAHAHYEAWKSYDPKPYDRTITLFRAREQRLLSVDPTLGWGRYGDVRIIPVPGNHRTILRGDDVPRVARLFDEELAASGSNE